MKDRYIVYALVDPRDSTIFYVGKSCSGLKHAKRHTQPRELRFRNPDKCRKIQDILDSGMSPEVRVLETCKTSKELAMRERVHIAAMRSQHLLNVQSNPSRYRGTSASA